MHRLWTRKIVSVVQVSMGVASKGVREREKGVRKEWRGRFWDFFFWCKNVMNETDKENEAEGYIYTTQTVHVVQISKWDIKERGLEGGGDFSKEWREGTFFSKRDYLHIQVFM